jgi:Periplasmic binding protein
LLGGRPLTLIRRDDESNPSKGQIAARKLIFKEGVVALFGGIDSPVSLAIVPLANKEKIPFMGVWAAATPITRNGANPNFVFRVSAVDELVDKALVQYAVKKYAAKRPGLMLINNLWGESNEKGLSAAITAAQIEAAAVEKFEANDVDMVPQLSRLKAAQADIIFLVANAAPGAQMMKSLERMEWTVPVVSHWGISGGRFREFNDARGGSVLYLCCHPEVEHTLQHRPDLALLRRVGPAGGTLHGAAVRQAWLVGLAHGDAGTWHCAGERRPLHFWKRTTQSALIAGGAPDVHRRPGSVSLADHHPTDGVAGRAGLTSAVPLHPPG